MKATASDWNIQIIFFWQMWILYYFLSIILLITDNFLMQLNLSSIWAHVGVIYNS